MSEQRNDSDPFRDIRPYHDHEVPQVMARLLGNHELQRALLRLRYRAVPHWLISLLRPLSAVLLRRQMAGVQTVADFQAQVESYVERMLADTTRSFTASGLEGLDATAPYLYLSNHRDITLDPALVNFALYRRGRDTVRIAIGDNLLTRDYATDLMRLNKSFIVRRSASGPRQVLAAYRELSNYIRHSICVERAPVWLAQREGRAKDGWDRTDPAIVKMLAMSKAKAESLNRHVADLRIVPVAISYELDPCDASKAAELYQREQTGDYHKAEDEDLRNIAVGIAGHKGAVHVAFGEPLQGQFESPEQVAAAVDRQILSNYRIPVTSLYAWRAVHGDWPEDCSREEVSEQGERVFLQRIDALPAEHRDHALGMYLNPIRNRREFFAQYAAAAE